MILGPLEARVLAEPGLGAIAVEQSVEPLSPDDEAADIDIEDQPLGPMPLWRLGR